jgi:hypothetical protein
MEKELSASTQGSGASAHDHSVAAGAGGFAAGRGIHGGVHVINATFQGVEVSIPSPQASSTDRATLWEKSGVDTCRITHWVCLHW